MEDSFRADAKRTILVNLFMDDIADGNYKLIQKMYEIAGVQKKELQEQRTIRRGYNANLSKKIFYDIRDILIEKIIGDEVIEQAFIDLCSIRWPDVVTMYETILNDLEKYYNIWKKLDDFRGYFLDYLLVNNKSLTKEDYHDKMDLNFKIIRNTSETHGNSFTTTLNHDIRSFLYFDDSDEFVLDSSVYDKFIKRRYEALAEYLGVKSADVATEIRSTFKYYDYVEDKGFLFDFGGFPFMTANLIDYHKGNMLWLDKVTASKKLKEYDGRGFGYYVDVDKIISEYYKNKVISVFLEKDENDEPFTKSSLFGGWKGPIEAEFKDIQHLCVVDIVYHLFEIEEEIFYENFSWEHYTGKHIEERYSAIVESLEKTISSKNSTISDLEERVRELEHKSNKNTDAIVLKQEREKEELRKSLEAKDIEIKDLKEQMKVYEEFEDIQKQIEDDVTESVDPELLKTKRYLFAGHESDIVGKLKREFPNSVFITENTTDISNIKVDGIVMLISKISHSLYYKIKKSSIYREVDTVLCNSDNINNVYLDMSKVFTDFD